MPVSYNCLGGTVEEPRKWHRLDPTGRRPDQELVGRWCKFTAPYTSPRTCSSCPAYRGVRYDGSPATGLTAAGDPYALSDAEYRRWQETQEYILETDDFQALDRFAMFVLEGIGDQALRRMGDPGALDRRAAYMRDWYAAHADEVRAQRRAGRSDRQREKTRERVARLRAKQKAAKEVTPDSIRTRGAGRNKYRGE